MNFGRIVLVTSLSALALVACRSGGDDTNNGPDASHTGDGGNTGDGGGSAEVCASYTTSTVAAMRMGTKTGCFELDNVVAIGKTPSAKSPQVFVQDAGGTDFSAMVVKCASTNTEHPCTSLSIVTAINNGDKLTVKGTYIKSSSTTFEEFYVDTAADNGAGTLPTPAAATLADIERSGTAANLRFQRVTLTISATDELLMYDWSPAEFVVSGATSCSYVDGWGMIPKSATGTTTPTAGCTSGSAQPTGQASPNPEEVLIGTDFYKTFTDSSDCRCAKTFMDMEPETGSTLQGAVAGILDFDVPDVGTGYYYLDPQTTADAPITGLGSGM